jgi:hypothetical protein
MTAIGMVFWSFNDVCIVTGVKTTLADTITEAVTAS